MFEGAAQVVVQDRLGMKALEYRFRTNHFTMLTIQQYHGGGEIDPKLPGPLPGGGLFSSGSGHRGIGPHIQLNRIETTDKFTDAGIGQHLFMQFVTVGTLLLLEKERQRPLSPAEIMDGGRKNTSLWSFPAAFGGLFAAR